MIQAFRKKTLTPIITLALVMVPMAGIALSPAVSAATCSQGAAADGDEACDSKAAACAAIGLTGDDCGGTTAVNRVSTTVQKIVNLLSWIVGVAAVIMIVISGFRYITSGGDSSKVGGAKMGLIYAIVGLVVVALSQFIVHFVLSNV